MAALITLAARASLSANREVIEVLRLIGARDVYVARAFVRRISIRAIGGTLVGAAIGVILVVILPPPSDPTGLFSAFGFRGIEWLWPFSLPPAAGLVAFASSRWTALGTLRRTT